MRFVSQRMSLKMNMRYQIRQARLVDLASRTVVKANAEKTCLYHSGAIKLDKVESSKSAVNFKGSRNVWIGNPIVMLR